MVFSSQGPYSALQKFCSVSTWCLTLEPHGLQHTRLPCLLEFAQTHVCWVRDAIQPSHPVIPFSCCPQQFPALGSYFQWVTSSNHGQSTAASASVFPVNILGWFSLGLTALISMLSKGLSRVFLSTIIWKHHFLGTRPSLWSNSHVCTWPLEKP